jgi:CheY-like chemotaxis protein
MTPCLVLIVEDEPLIAMFLREFLELIGHNVCAVATTEEEAVRAATEWQPTLLIIDEHLKEGSGLAAMERIEQSAHIPHIFVSGDLARIRKLRPDAEVLRKPYTPDELERAVTRAMANSAKPNLLDAHDND